MVIIVSAVTDIHHSSTTTGVNLLLLLSSWFTMVNMLRYALVFHVHYSRARTCLPVL
jgi:hypothetical protein